MKKRMMMIGVALATVLGTASAEVEGSWDSLSTQQIPEWMKDAKFGFYAHFGVFSVPAHGGPDYIKNLYAGAKKDEKGTYSYHTKKYGTLDQFGYKDFVPLFKAEKFNADEWAGLMHEAGARFGGTLLVHHDGFLMWASKVNRWNAGNMGPKRDIYGQLVTALRKYDDMKVVATFHHARTFGYATGFMEKEKGIPVRTEENKNWDVWNPEYNDFYWNEAIGASRKEFARQWEAKVKEVIDNYSPDCIWFDGLSGGMKNNTPSEQQVKDTLAYYFNQAEKKGQQVVVCNKNAHAFNFPESFGLLCYENGRDMPKDVGPWFLIDRAIGYPWCYVNGKTYRDGPDYQIRSLIDLVSRGGIFLMSLTPKGDGSIPDGEVAIMKGMGRWLKVNGEAIYATRPWKVYAEGPTVIYGMTKRKSGAVGGGWDYRKNFTSQDIRFTRSKDGKTLYATALNWPEKGKIVVKSLAKGSKYYPGEIHSVEMLGVKAPVKWTRTADGLEITFPEKKPDNFEWAYAFRIK